MELCSPCHSIPETILGKNSLEIAADLLTVGKKTPFGVARVFA
jgi:hypothetical protein